MKRKVHYYGARSVVQVHPSATRHTWKSGTTVDHDGYFYAPSARKSRGPTKKRRVRIKKIVRQAYTEKTAQRNEKGILTMSWGAYQRLRAKYGKQTKIPRHQ